MSNMSKHHNSPPSSASPFVDTLNTEHNVLEPQMRNASAVLQNRGAAEVVIRIAGFNDSGGLDEDRCYPSADGTTDESLITKKMERATELNNVAVAVQVRGLDTGTEWLWASDVLSEAEEANA